MDNWKLQLVVVAFCALVHSYQGLSFSVEEESGPPKDWQVSSNNLPLSKVTYIKRSKALKFYGLMGKRAGRKPPTQMNRRRNKGQMFVGLMGRSISSGDSLTRIIPSATSTALDVSEESHKQGMIVLVQKPEVYVFVHFFFHHDSVVQFVI
uniref:Uncharacterized protein n=1 Tax=Myripristis murdjan TaxID=586833 RepID=A0A667ZPM9_9TELE